MTANVNCPDLIFINIARSIIKLTKINFIIFNIKNQMSHKATKRCVIWVLVFLVSY